MRRSALALALCLIAAPALAGGCITPPIVRAGGTDRLPFAELPPDAEPASVLVGESESLRGVFVPSDREAPVVLHFLESGGSATNGTRGIGAYPYLERLADRGFASLVLDYRGVGMSDGTRSVHHVRADARAAWAEAVRRAGGADRVILRGVSLGAIAVAGLLDEGMQPRAVILVAPVRAETVAGNYARRSYGGFLGGIAALFLRDAGDADVVAAVGAVDAPVLILAAENDALIGPDEQAALARVVDGHAGIVESIADETHLGLVLRANELTPTERDFLESVAPEAAPLEVRLAALDLADADSRVRKFVAKRRTGRALARAAGQLGFPRTQWAQEQFVRWWRDLTWGGATFDDAETSALLDFDDPSGTSLDPRELPTMRRLAETVEAPDRLQRAQALVALARERGLASVAWYSRAPEDGVGDPLLQMMHGTAEARRDDGQLPADAPARLQLDDDGSFRGAVRLLLKAAGIPERVVDRGAAGFDVEISTDRGWQTLDLTRPRRVR